MTAPSCSPELPGGWAAPDAIVLRSLLDARTGCVVVEQAAPRCGQDRVMAPEEPLGLDREVRLPARARRTPPERAPYPAAATT